MTQMLTFLETLSIQDSDTPLSDSWLLGFDTETTGIRAGSDAIVSASLVLREPGNRDNDHTAEWIINPHRHISAGASRVNGFTDAYLQEHGQEPIDALEQIAAIIASALRHHIPLLAYNAPFDVHMLEGDLQRWKLRSLAERDATLCVVDPLVLDRAIAKKRAGKRTLAATCEYYGVEPDGDFHNATADTRACVDLIEPMSLLYPQVGHLTIGSLMPWQRDAYGEWKNNFNQWLASRGRTLVTDSWL